MNCCSVSMLNSVEGRGGVKTEFCPDVAGFCHPLSRILSASGRNVSWCAMNNGRGQGEPVGERQVDS